MVYTIISKLPFITSDKSNKRFFKIFVFGSLIYVLLHYYLFQKDQEGILDSVKTYLYYAMALDFCLAYALDQWIGEEEKQDDTLPNNQKQQKQPPSPSPSNQQQTQTQQVNKYTPEQRAEYERKYVEWKKQQDFMKEKEQQPKQKKECDEKVEDDEFEKEDDEPSLPKVTKKTKTSERSERSNGSKKSSKSLPEDTDIPRFVRK